MKIFVYDDRIIIVICEDHGHAFLSGVRRTPPSCYTVFRVMQSDSVTRQSKNPTYSPGPCGNRS